MKLSASFLSIKNNIKDNIEKLDNSNIDYLHLDIMDNVFVPNISFSIDEITELLKNTNRPKDVHLMVKDVYKYIDDYSNLNPDYMTFHLEATNDVLSTINYIKEKKIKVGLSIKPNTKLDELKNYLPLIDLVLVMSVEPGYGGQSFIPSVLDKIKELRELRDKYNYNYLIEVDGGINNETITQLKSQNVDMVVVGSYITNSNDYNEQINKLNLK